jgi:hypothetical protein
MLFAFRGAASITRNILVIAASLAICGITAHADDKITLKLDVEPGQVWKFDRSYDEAMNSKAQANGQTQTDENKNHQQRTGVIEVLTAKDGRPTSVKLTFGADCENSMASDSNQQKQQFAFAGQTMTVTRGNDGSVQTDFQGQADPNAMNEVKAVLDPDLSLYPDHAVAIGEEWKVNPEISHKQLGVNGPNDTGDMTMKLLSVKDVNGRPTAEIAVNSQASIDMHGVVRKTQATGSALVDVQTGHVMQFALKGTSNIAGTAKEQGNNGSQIEVRWDGDGTMTMSMVSQAAKPGDAPSALSAAALPAVAPTNAPNGFAGGTPAQSQYSPSAQPYQQSQPTAAQPAAGAPGKMLGLETAKLMDDPSYIGGEVWHFLVPAGWKTEGGVRWDLSATYPATTQMRVFDPNSAEGFELNPMLMFTWSLNQNSPLGYHPQVGSKYAGGIYEPPVQDIYSAITKVVLPIYYKDLVSANARVVDKEELPKLAQLAVSRVIPLPGTQLNGTAARMRFEYDANGQTIQQDVYAAMTVQVNQQFKNVNWNISLIISQRAPKGMIDQVKTYRLVMQRSIVPNIQWYNKLYQFTESANRQRIKEIQAAAERSRIFAQMTDEVNEQRKEQFENYQKSTSEQALAFDQYIRDVTPFSTPNGPPVELPNAYSNAWQGTNGQYIMTNDPTYNPAADPNNNQFGWTQLTPQR